MMSPKEATVTRKVEEKSQIKQRENRSHQKQNEESRKITVKQIIK